jgi:hypothetical protein
MCAYVFEVMLTDEWPSDSEMFSSDTPASCWKVAFSGRISSSPKLGKLHFWRILVKDDRPDLEDGETFIDADGATWTFHKAGPKRDGYNEVVGTYNAVDARA